MAKHQKAPRRGVDRRAATTKPSAGRSCAPSLSARSTVSTSKADRNPLKAVGKLHKGLEHSTAKSARKKNDDATHQKCLAMMDEIQEEFQLALEEIDKERTHDSQSMQRLHGEKAQETSKLQEAITAKDKALAENQR
ncbi:unnamed protein product, partial [Penicillium nalgiovense]